MEAVILMGLQACGKTTFCRDRFFDTHVRLNLDMLRTRHRERRLLATLIDIRQSFVVDNTNPTIAERAVYIDPAKASGFRVIGYYFKLDTELSLRRNEARDPAVRIPTAGVLGTYKRFELPGYAEGFDELHYVQSDTDDDLLLSEWQDELQ